MRRPPPGGGAEGARMSMDDQAGRGGFTIAEVLVAILITGLVSGIIFASYMGAIRIVYSSQKEMERTALARLIAMRTKSVFEPLNAVTAGVKEFFMKSLALKVRRFLVAEDGPTAVEYAVMLALIVIVCLGTITTIGTNANVTFNSVATKLSSGS